ncbi:MAG: hypothetical protein KAI47_05655 [Deltaproteobacteria bacterium]|nr:hypothetical protein [Deltaproteobacteria bacterium]
MKRHWTRITALALGALVALGMNDVAQAAQPMPRPYVELTVKGATYKPGATVEVRLGEKIRVGVKVMGGRRAWCMQPGKYANVGRRMVITSNNENGLSFTINNGQFRGDWTLKSEKATFFAGQGARVKKVSDRAADVEFPDARVGQTYFKVTVKARWHYVRHTPAGRRVKNEDQEATNKFHFKIGKSAGAWYSSRNVVATGTEDFRVRGRLDYIQRFFNQIEAAAKKRDFAAARRILARLKTEVKSLEEAIREQKAKGKGTCKVTIMGSPLGQVLADMKKIKLMTRKWKDLAVIATGNVQKINGMLHKTQMTFSANVLRSVFKNYINWGTSIPTGAEDLLTSYDPNNRLTPFDLPRKVMGWWETANKDSSILKNQVRTIRILSQLRTFYLKKMKDAVAEKRTFHTLLNQLKPARAVHRQWAGIIRGRRSVRWKH